MKHQHCNGWKKGTMLVLPAHGVTGSKRILLQVMFHLSDWKGRLHPTIDDLARLSGLSRSTVKRLLPELEASSVLCVLQKGVGRRPNWYQISDLRSGVILSEPTTKPVVGSFEPVPTE